MVCELGLAALAYAVSHWTRFPVPFLKENPHLYYTYQADKVQPEDSLACAGYEAREDAETDLKVWLSDVEQTARRGPVYGEHANVVTDLRAYYLDEPGACRRDYRVYTQEAA